MRELIDKLKYYTKLYDEGTPEISDEEFDNLYFKLADMEKESGLIYPDSPTQSINYEVKSSLEKVTHNHQMLSLAKTKDWLEFLSYFDNINSYKAVIGMIKLDGLTCSLRYVNGKLVSAETRGDGVIGENILHNAKVISSIPQEIAYKEELVIDGEIICTYNDFLEFVNDYKNPRNFAAGSIRLLNANECEKRKLTFVCWNVVSGFTEINSFLTKLVMLAELGFLITPYTSSFDLDAKEYLITQAKGLGYPIDGLVGKFDDIDFGLSLGTTGHHVRYAYAFKMYDEEYETNLIDIEYETSRNGTLTPVAIFNPIEIDGSVVTRASLSNISIMKETLSNYLPWKNQKIWVTKRNCIIPKIERAEEDDNTVKLYIDYPVTCPTCGHSVQFITSASGVETLICTNKACPSKIINILDHYCGRSGMDIKGLSKATLEKLLEWNWLGDITDIYKLSDHRSEWVKKSGFGVASVDKILNAIEESKKCDLDKFLVALGIPLVGPQAAKEITRKFTTWSDFFNSISQNFNYSTLPNFGFEICKSILSFNYSEAEYIAEHYLQFNNVLDTRLTKSLQNVTFCITGSVHLYKNRTELQNLIESLGGKVTGSVSKNTNWLINNDVNSNSSKNLTAQRLGIPIITEEEFQNLLEIT